VGEVFAKLSSSVSSSSSSPVTSSQKPQPRRKKRKTRDETEKNVDIKEEKRKAKKARFDAAQNKVLQLKLALEQAEEEKADIMSEDSEEESDTD